MDQTKTLVKANENLTKRFKMRHDKPITMADIDAAYNRNTFSIESDAKTKKGTKNGYLTGILYLAPSNISGINTCPAASQGCAAACLFEAGRGVMYPVFRARVIKTLAFYLDRARYIKAINKSIKQLKTKAKNKNMVPVVRLNGTSDLLWDRLTNLMLIHPDVQFYDYSKITRRFKMEQPPNYDITYSLHETNQNEIQKIVASGGRVAVVFRNELPDSYWGVPVVDGDSTDLRFLDPKNCIVGLKAKGPAKTDTSGFVLDAYQNDTKKVA